MKIEDVRPAERSKTICALNHSDKIQNIVIVLGALAFGAWVVLPSSAQEWVQDKVVPVTSAMMTGAALAAKWYNGKAKNGRLQVGDLFTLGSDGNPNPGDFAKRVLLNEAQSILLSKFFEDSQTPTFSDAITDTVKSGAVSVVSAVADPIGIDTVDVKAEDPKNDRKSEEFSIKL